MLLSLVCTSTLTCMDVMMGVLCVRHTVLIRATPILPRSKRAFVESPMDRFTIHIVQ